MNIFSKKAYYNAGQTSVEYILMIAVSAILVKSASGLIEERLIGDMGNCTNQSVSYICKFENITNFNGFRYFVLRR